MDFATLFAVEYVTFRIASFSPAVELAGWRRHPLARAGGHANDWVWTCKAYVLRALLAQETP